jgi:hypothetical protein
MSKRVATPAGWTRTAVGIYIPIPSGTSAVEWVTDLDLDVMFEVEAAIFSTAIAATGAGANRTLRVLKGASTVVATGTLTLAGMSDVGEQTALTVTDDGETNRFEPGDLLSVDSPAAGAVSFTEGQGNLTLLLRTMPQTLV